MNVQVEGTTKAVKGEIMTNADRNYYHMLTDRELIERVVYPRPDNNYRELCAVLARRLVAATKKETEEVRVEL